TNFTTTHRYRATNSRRLPASLLYRYNDSSDIIRPTVLIGALYKVIDTILRAGLIYYPADFIIAYQSRETIGTEHQRIFILYLFREYINLNIGLCAQATRNHIALCMSASLIFRQETCPHLFGHPGVILRHLLYLATTHDIRTAITNIGNVCHIATQYGSNTGC